MLKALKSQHESHFIDFNKDSMQVVKRTRWTCGQQFVDSTNTDWDWKFEEHIFEFYLFN